MTQNRDLFESDFVERLYGELRKLAAARLRSERPGQTLQATALVHEVVLRLERPTGRNDWASPAQYFSAAAVCMRRILIEQARRKRRLKRGGDRRRVSLSVAEPFALNADEDVEAVSAALDRFEQIEPQKAEVVKLRYFAGLTVPQIAEALGISVATVERRWAYARAWLYRELAGEADDQKT